MEDPEAPGQVLECPDDGVLRLDGGPLAELIVAEVCLEGFAYLTGEVPVGLLGRFREAHGLWLGAGTFGGRFRCPLRFGALAPEDPLPRHTDETARLRLRDDQSGCVSGEFLPLGPLLDGNRRNRLPDPRGEIPLGHG